MCVSMNVELMLYSALKDRRFQVKVNDNFVARHKALLSQGGAGKKAEEKCMLRCRKSDWSS